MQVLQAGQHKFIFLELDAEIITDVARQAGFDIKIKDGARTLAVELIAAGRNSPLLLFDAADPANLGWFSRCQFYVDGRTGAVMQPPMACARRSPEHYERIARKLPSAWESASHRKGFLPAFLQFFERAHQDWRGRVRRGRG